MSQQYNFPAGFATSSNPADGTPGNPAPTEATQVGGVDGGGLLRAVSVDTTGKVNVNVSSSVLPTGAATAANQVLEIADLDSIVTATAAIEVSAQNIDVTTQNIYSSVSSIDSKTVIVDTQDVHVTASALPAGAATDTLQTAGNASLSAINGKFGSLGQKTMAGSAPVVIASDQSAVPVSLASVPLPTGAATSALQVSGNTLLTTIASNQTNGTQVTAVNNFPATQAISAVSLPLPTGASTEATLSALNGKFGSLGQKTMAGSAPVVIASDQGSIPTSSGGNTPLQFIRNDYTSAPVTTGAYAQLIASTSGITNVLEIFDSSGQTLKIAFGAAASEVDKFLVFPGGNGRITCAIPASTRISIKAVSANATVGELDLNLYT